MSLLVVLTFGLLVGPLQSPTHDGIQDSTCVQIYAQADSLRDSISDYTRRFQTPPDSSTRKVALEILQQIRRLRECERVLPSANRLMSYQTEAFAYAILQQFSEAFRSFDVFFDRFANVPDTASLDPVLADWYVWYPRMYVSRGYIHYSLGNLSGAIDDYSRAISLLPDSSLLRIADYSNDLGAIYSRAGNTSAALRMYRRSESIVLSIGIDQDALRRRYALSLYAQSDLIASAISPADSRQVRKALSLVQRSLEIYTLSDDSRMKTIRLELFGELQAYSGQHDSALQTMRRAIEIARAQNDVTVESRIHYKQAHVFMQRGEWERAASVLDHALSLARNTHSLDTQRRILRRLGHLYEIRGQYDRAEGFYRDAISVVETYRESLRATEWSVGAFSGWQDVYRGLARVLLATNRTDEAFQLFERTRARHLTDLRLQARIANDLSPERQASFDSLTQALTNIRSRLATESLSSSEEADLSNRESSLVAQRRDLIPLDDATGRLSLADLQARLRSDGRALVSYFVDVPAPLLGREASPHAFVVTADMLRAVSLPGLTSDSLRTLMKQASPLFSDSSASVYNERYFDLSALHSLHEVAVAPLRPYLADGAPLTVIPDGPLFELPFSMLVTEPPENRFSHASARYLIQDRPVSLELAASLLTDSTSRVPDPRSFDTPIAAFGVSTFESSRLLPSSVRSAVRSPSDDSTASDSSISVLEPLPGVEAEIRSVDRLFGDAYTALNDEATETAFHERGTRVGILHLASHAFVDPSSPLNNALILRPGPSSAPSDDGFLFLHELRQDVNQIPLVVLSGCSTARGKLNRGEGMSGLQYGFRAMGARATLSNLWPADDDAAVELSTAFYRHLRDGHAKDVALQRAQIEYIENNPDHASPFFWAPIVLYGDPGSLPFVTSSWNRAWVYILGSFFLVAIVVTSYLLYRRRSRRGSAFA